MYVCMHVCVCLSMYVCMYVCINACICVCLYECMYMCTRARACAYACAYARARVCVRVCISITLMARLTWCRCPRDKKNTSLTFLLCLRSRHRKGSINVYVRHLCLAGMLVAYITIPTEIAWNYYVRWLAGDAACRFLMFLRTLGLYASSFVLVIISIDRLRVMGSRKGVAERGRGKGSRRRTGNYHGDVVKRVRLTCWQGGAS